MPPTRKRIQIGIPIRDCSGAAGGRACQGAPRELLGPAGEWTIGCAIGELGTSTGGPATWATATIWHCLGINIEGHSEMLGRNPAYRLFIGETGLVRTVGYWGRLQPNSQRRFDRLGLSAGPVSQTLWFTPQMSTITGKLAAFDRCC